MQHNAFKTNGEGYHLRRVLSAGAMSLLLLMGQTAPLLGNPTGGTVVAGSASIGAAGATLSINQSTQNAIINWQQFSIASGETTKFIVPNSGATLNRVTGGNPSAIYGHLQSNGTLYLVNPNGIVVGPSGRIDTAGFLASTLDISNQQFMAGGNLEFSGSSGASVENDGIVHASTGDVYLIANQVTNKGTLSAPQGTVGLAAGSDVLFQQAGNQHLFVQATPAGTTRALGVTNAGTIRAAAAELKAAGGNAYALAINNTGVIAATGYKKINGQVYLTSDGGSISNRGRISAQQADGNGGTIVLNGTAVTSKTSGTVTNSGTLDASAHIAGGQGGTVTIKNMGGTTTDSGSILAQGGPGGAGGDAEVSGNLLQYTGSVNLSAPGGTTGNLLFDPENVTIEAGGSSTTTASGSPTDTFTGGVNDSILTVSDLENALANSNVTVTTGGAGSAGSQAGDITVNAAVSWSAGTSLTLSAYRNITLNSNLTNTSGAGTAGVTLRADNSGTGVGTVAFANGALVSTAGAVTIFYNPSVNPAGSAVNTTSYVNPTENFTSNVTGGATLTTYMLVNTVDDLQNMQNNLTGNYALGGNIDASATSTWNGGAGFVPIGKYDFLNSSDASTFSGQFDGQGYTISGLTIDVPSATSGTGLFGDTAGSSTIENLNLTAINITGNEYVGGLVGVDNATVSNVTSSGMVTGTTDVGGLLGISYATVSNSSNAGTVTDDASSYGHDLGGVVGFVQGGSITGCFNTATISGPASNVGGVVGLNESAVSNSYNLGTIQAINDTEVGGLVGTNYNGSIVASYSTGAVFGGGATGGLVGANDTATISDSYSSGAVDGNATQIGGLVGYNTGTLTNVYSIGAVTSDGGSSEVGGLVGQNSSGTVTNAYSSGRVSAGVNSSDVGGLLGYNGGTVSNSFWDTTTSAVTLGVGSDSTNTTPGVIGDSTSTLLNQSTYTTNTNNGAAWSIGTDLTGDTWVIFNGQTRPLLSMEYSTTVTNAHQLQLIGLNPTANYTLANNIDASGTTNSSDIWGTSTSNGGGGFVPLGSGTANFTGTFDGMNYTISGLTINDGTSAGNDGLFGVVGTSGIVMNVGLSGGSVTGAGSNVGALVGDNNGMIENDYSSATVTGSTNVGGLIGSDSGTVQSSYATGTVSGQNQAGGLIGSQGGGSVNLCYATGNVSSGSTAAGNVIGGLIGTTFYGTVTNSYASGNVTGYGQLGGLAGANGSTIVDCYATGSVDGGYGLIGGLVGINYDSVATSYSAGAVNGNGGTSVGGLVGQNSGLIATSYWATDVGPNDSLTTVGSGLGTIDSYSSGKTLAQLKQTSTFDSSWSFPNVWTTNGGTTTPQLVGVGQVASLDTLSGTAFTDSGVTMAGANTTIDLIFDGSLLGSTTTNSSGGFTFSISSTDLTGGILLTDPTHSGNTFYQANSPASTISGIDIWGNTLRVTADSASNTALANTAGSLTGAGINYSVSGGNLTTNAGINMNILASYTLDGNVYADGLLTTNAASVLGASSVVSLSGNSVNLAGSINDTDYILVKAVAGDITVTGPVTSTTPNLIMLATGNINVDANVTASNVTLQSDLNGTGVGTVAFHNEAQVSSSGNVLIFYNPSVNPAGSAVNSTSYVNPTENYPGDVTGGATLTAYMLVNTLNDLQNVQNNLSGTYALSHNIDASATSGWNGGAGFTPIGNSATSFNGTFNGQNYAIDALTINTPSGYDVGLFGAVGIGATLENFGVTNVQISGTDYVGAIVGNNSGGTLDHVYATGTLNGPSETDAVGGLAGANTGTISYSYSTVAINAPDAFGNVGGGVGVNYGIINDCYATGAVNGAAGSDVGGFIGQNSGGTITNSYSTGAVTGAEEVGGFIGINSGTATNCFWDTDTSGQVFGTGGATTAGETGATTAQLTSQSFILANAPSSPTFDFTNVWTTVGGTLTPQLIGLPQTALPTGTSADILSGTAFTDSGVTATGSGTTIDLIFDGSLLGSTTTNSSGGFTFSISSTDLTGGIVLTDATDNGNTYYQANSPSGTISGVDIWGGTLRVTADTASNAALKLAAGNLTSASGVNYAVAGANLSTTSGVSVDILSGYTLDGNITAAGAGSFTTASGAALTGSSNVTLTGSTVTLSGAASLTGTLTVDSTSGQILLTNFGNSEVPVTAGGITLNSTGAVLVNKSNISLTGGNFSATGTGYISSVDANGEANGINLFDSTIDAGGGDITLTGTAGYTGGESGLASGLGVGIGTDGQAPMSLSTTGNGNITISGTCNQNVTSQFDFYGVELYTDSDESSNTVSVANGTLSINGTVTRGATTTNDGVRASLGGVKITGASVAEATGTGAVEITGAATGTSVDGLIGVNIDHGYVGTVDGNLTIQGTATGTSTVGSAGVGVVNSSVVESTGAGSVTVTGNSTASSSSFNVGIYVDNASLASSGSGGLALTGSAGTVTGSAAVTVNSNEYNPFSTGIFLTNGSNVTAANTGSIRLIGTGGPNASTAPLDAYGGDYGVYFYPFASTNTSVTSSGGGIAITGTGGSGAGTSYNGGIYVGPATIQDTGDGDVTLTGTAGAGVDNNIGVAIEGDSTIVQTGGGSSNGDSLARDNAIAQGESGNSSGVLTIIGRSSAGDTGQDNNGVAIFGGAAIDSGAGGIAITGASPANGTGSNDSIGISEAYLVTANGTLSVTSTAGDITLEASDTAQNSVIYSPVGSTSNITDAGGPVSLSGGNYSLTQSSDLTLGPVSVQVLNLSVDGNITQSAPMTAALLNVSSADAVTLTNAGNNITVLGSLALNGALSISTDPGTTLSGAITDTAPITIEETGGDIVFGPNGSITDSGEGNNVILAAGTNLANSHYLINHATGSAIQVANGANFYLYSSDPTYDTFGNITVLPVNMIYGATYPPSDLPTANEALFFVAAAGDVGPNNPNPSQTMGTPPPSTTTGGAGGAGSTIVPPALVPQSSPGNTVPTSAEGSTVGEAAGSTPPPFSFTGTGISQVLGQEDGGLANSAGNSGQVTTGDAAQLNDGQLNSVANPQASSALNEALGPIVYQNLSDALRNIGDWAGVPDSVQGTTSDDSGETILTSGDVAEMTSSTVKNIPLDKAPKQLQQAMGANVLNGMGHGH